MSRTPAPAVSLAALTVLEVSPLEAARVAAQCGYSHIGLRPIAATPTEVHFPILSDRRMAGELASILQSEGVGVLDLEIVRLTADMDWDQIDAVLEFAERFGAQRLLVADNDPDSSRSHANLARLAERAAAFAVVPCLEFMPWTCAPDLAAAKQRIGGIANCGMLIDAFHLARSGGNPDEISSGDTDIRYVQLCDIAGPSPAMEDILREARSDRLMPGQGAVDLVSLLRRLPDRPISLEVPSDRLRDAGLDALARARMAMEHTLELLDRIDAID